MTRPGAVGRRLAQRLCTESAMERLIDPAIADWQHEYEQAAAHGLVWRSRVIRAAGYVAFWKVAMIAAARFPRHERLPTDDHAVRRTVAYSTAAVSILVVLLLLPTLDRVSGPDLGKTARLVLYAIPSAVPIALPLGLPFGILFALRDRTSTRRANVTILAMAVGCSAVALVVLAWLMPATNQAFRELAAGRRVMRGFNELTLGELAFNDPTEVMRLISGGVNARRLAWEFQSRVALAGAPLTLCLFSLTAAVATRRRHGRMAIAAAAFTASLGYYVLLFSARQHAVHGERLPATLAAWLPNLVLLTMTLILVGWTLSTKTQGLQQ